MTYYPWDEDGTMPLERYAPMPPRCPPCPQARCAMYWSPLDVRWHCRCGSAAQIGDRLVYTEEQSA